MKTATVIHTQGRTGIPGQSSGQVQAYVYCRFERPSPGMRFLLARQQRCQIGVGAGDHAGHDQLAAEFLDDLFATLDRGLYRSDFATPVNLPIF